MNFLALAEQLCIRTPLIKLWHAVYITDTENHQENNEEMDAVTDVSPCTAGVPYEAVWEISRLAPISEDCDPPNEYDSEILSVLDSESSMELIMG